MSLGVAPLVLVLKMLGRRTWELGWNKLQDLNKTSLSVCRYRMTLLLKTVPRRARGKLPLLQQITLLHLSKNQS